MVGEGYWTTGIWVHWAYAGGGRFGWSANAKFYDDGFCQQDSTEGMLRTRYHVTDGTALGGSQLARAIDILKADAERLGIEFRWIADQPPSLYCDDGPNGWPLLLAEQAARLGWQFAVDWERAATQATEAGGR